MKKTFTSILLGGATTFGLFAFMAFLIGNEESRVVDVNDPVVITVYQTPDDSKVNEIERPKLQPPEPPKPMPITPVLTATDDVDPTFVYQQPVVAIPDNNPGFRQSGMISNSEARPVVRVNPRYPIVAARDGIEGWVSLAFDINEIGEVTNIKVLESSPKRIFDKAARQALKKWKYRAKVIEDRHVKQHGLTVRLDFNMEQQKI